LLPELLPLGSVESDRASYRQAAGHLEQAVTLSRAGREPRRQAYALSMLGRISLFRGALDAAAGQLDGYILDAQCDLGRRHGHPDTGLWVEMLRNLASRSGMRELTLRSLQHGAALGRAGDSTAAAVLADELAESC
jgi:hypothetical protein